MAFRTVAELLLLTSIAFGTWQSRAGRGDGDWPSFGRDPGARRYSPLTQITRQNVGLAESRPGRSIPASRTFRSRRSSIDGLMYLTGGDVRARAGDRQDSLEVRRAQGAGQRGAASPTGPVTGRSRRGLFSGVGDGRLVALDARTGKPVAGFGDRGYVDLKASVRGDVDGALHARSPRRSSTRTSSLPAAPTARGSRASGLYGDIRGWDARTGQAALVVPHRAARRASRASKPGRARAGRTARARTRGRS